MELLCFYKICNYICGACPSPCFSSLIYYKGIQVCDGIGFCNMSLGFKVGEDEHAAYIAGFAGDCVSEFINSKNTD